jgi:hypothetical protein
VSLGGKAYPGYRGSLDALYQGQFCSPLFIKAYKRDKRLSKRIIRKMLFKKVPRLKPAEFCTNGARRDLRWINRRVAYAA